MARSKKQSKTQYKLKSSHLKIEKGSSAKEGSFFDKIQNDLEDRQSIVSLVLGALIIIIVGILLYNYFNKPAGDLGPSQQTNLEDTSGDVTKENLPGKYTVKADDTLFSIALHYYDDGYKYQIISDANNLSNPNAIQAGQVLDIPKGEESAMLPQESEVPGPSPTEEAQLVIEPSTSPEVTDSAKGGAINQTIWGESIEGNTYTVIEGDWLSTIAGRAYGDVFSYEKIAEANNISNPDLIEPGMTLKIPK